MGLKFLILTLHFLLAIEIGIFSALANIGRCSERSLTFFHASFHFVTFVTTHPSCSIVLRVRVLSTSRNNSLVCSVDEDPLVAFMLEGQKKVGTCAQQMLRV